MSFDTSRRTLRHQPGYEQLRKRTKMKPIAVAIPTRPTNPQQTQVDPTLMSGLDSLERKFAAMAATSGASGDGSSSSRSRRHRSVPSDQLATSTASAMEDKSRLHQQRRQPPVIPLRSTSSATRKAVDVNSNIKPKTRSPGIPRRKPVEADAIAIPVYDNGTAASYSQAQQLRKHSRRGVISNNDDKYRHSDQFFRRHAQEYCCPNTESYFICPDASSSITSPSLIPAPLRMTKNVVSDPTLSVHVSAVTTTHTSAINAIDDQHSIATTADLNQWQQYNQSIDTFRKRQESQTRVLNAQRAYDVSKKCQTAPSSSPSSPESTHCLPEMKTLRGLAEMSQVNEYIILQAQKQQQQQRGREEEERAAEKVTNDVRAVGVIVRGKKSYQGGGKAKTRNKKNEKKKGPIRKEDIRTTKKTADNEVGDVGCSRGNGGGCCVIM